MSLNLPIVPSLMFQDTVQKIDAKVGRRGTIYAKYAGTYDKIRELLPANIIEMPASQLNIKGLQYLPIVGTNVEEESSIDLDLMDDRKFVVNADTGHILSMMGSNYAVISHRETMDAAMNTLREAGLDISKAGCVLTMDRYGLNVNLRVLMQDVVITPTDGQAVYGMAEFINSLAGLSAFIFNYKGCRFICLNGMVRADELMSYRSKHFINAIDQKRAIEAITKGADAFHTMLPYFNGLCDEPLDKKKLEIMYEDRTEKDEDGKVVDKPSIMRELLGKKYSEGFQSYLENGFWEGNFVPGLNREKPTLYDGYNVITALAHLKSAPADRNKMEFAAPAFVDAYMSL